MLKPNAPNPIREIIAQERALAILRLLNGDLEGSTNDRVLARCLEVYALRSSREDLLEQLNLLERTGVVRLDMSGTFCVVSITNKGVEAAEGVATLDGIAKCSPGCPY